MGKHRQDCTKAVRQITLSLLCLVYVVASGCKSGGHNASEESPTAAPAKKRSAGTDQQDPQNQQNQQNPADSGRIRTIPGNGQSPSAKISGQPDPNSDSPKKEGEEGYEGGDPKLYNAPEHHGTPFERIETTTKASTPAPPSDRAIDRPLDPVGRPLFSPTPQG